LYFYYVPILNKITIMNKNTSLSHRIVMKMTANMAIVLLIMVVVSVLIMLNIAEMRTRSAAENEAHLLNGKIRDMKSHVETVGEASSKLLSLYLADPTCNRTSIENVINEIALHSDIIYQVGVLLDKEACQRHGISIEAPFRYGENTIMVDGVDLITPENRLDWYEWVSKKDIGIWSEDSTMSPSALIINSYSRYLTIGDELIGTMVFLLASDQILNLMDLTPLSPHAKNMMVGLEKSIVTTGSKTLDMDKAIRDNRFSGMYSKEQMIDTLANCPDGVLKVWLDGKKGWLCYTTLAKGRWVALSFIPSSDLFSRGHVTLFVGAFAFMLLIIGILVLLQRHTIRRMLRPLRKVVSATKKVAEGDFNYPLPVLYKGDEIQQLRDSFVVMQESLTQTIEKERHAAEEKGRLDSELKVAREIQLSMVTPIDEKETRYAAMIEPAREVGGDLYNFIPTDDKLFFSIGDVSGKGIPAAFIMTQVASLLRSKDYNIDALADNAINRVNKMHCLGNNINMFTTLMLCRLYWKTGQLDIYNAGHLPPIMILPDGTTSTMEIEPNIPVGLNIDMEYPMQTFWLQPGTTLLLYSDGVLDAINKQSEPYGSERLLNLLKNRQDHTPQEIVKVVKADISLFSQGMPQQDDITLLAIRFDPQD